MINSDPAGFDFMDIGPLKRLVCVGPWKGWVVYKHPDGQWVSLDKATQVDFHKAYQAMVGDTETDRKMPVVPGTGVPISQEEIDG